MSGLQFLFLIFVVSAWGLIITVRLGRIYKKIEELSPLRTPPQP